MYNSLYKKIKQIQKKDKYLLVLCIAIYTCVFSWFTILRHNNFSSSFDLANMDQTIWNTLHGNIFALSGMEGPISRFSIHADLILILLSPLYLLWDNVRLLLIFQSFVIALGAIPLYLLSQKILKDKIITWIIVGLYFIHTGNHWTNFYDFHPVSIAIPVLLGAFYFGYVKKWRWYFLCIFLALLTKEHVALTTGMIGLIFMLVFKERKIGIMTIMVSVIWFVSMVFIVIPYFSAENTHWALSWFTYNNPSTQQGSHIPTMSFILERLLDQSTQQYYMGLFRQIGFLSLLGLPWLVLILPDLFINTLSHQGQMRSIVFHYDAIMVPGLFISVIYGAKYLEKLSKKFFKYKPLQRYFGHIVLIFGAFIGLHYNYYHSPLPYTPSCWCFIYEVGPEEREFEELLKTIPKNSSITASPEVRPHLTHREFAYTLPTATQSADFIALIDQNRMVGNFNEKDFELRLIESLDSADDYTLVKKIGNFYLYKRANYLP